MRKSMSSAQPRILLVDDEPRAVELLTRSLRKQGRLEAAHSGDEAWQLFQGGEFCLVIADQRMPGMTGVDLLGRIAERDDTVGRILLTGYTDLEATVEAINRGRVHAFLHKPCSPPDLTATVKGVLDRVQLARRKASIAAAVAVLGRDVVAPLVSLTEIANALQESGEPRASDAGKRVAAETALIRQVCGALAEATLPSGPEGNPRSPGDG